MSDAERDRLLLEIHSAVAVVASKVDDHHTALFGNGSPGVKARVQTLEDDQRQCPARAAYTTERRSFRAVWAGIIVAGLLSLPATIQALAAMLTP